MKTKVVTFLAASFLAAGLHAQSTFSGNGNIGFGGPVGQGSLTLSDDGTTITFPVTTTGFVLTYYPAPALALSTVNVIGAP